MADLYIPESAKAPKPRQLYLNEDCSYFRDVIRFMQEIERLEGFLISVVGRSRGVLAGPYVIVYECSEEICIEVWC